MRTSTAASRALAALLALAATIALALASAGAAPARADQRDDAALGASVYEDLKAKSQVVEGSPYVPVLRRVGDRIAAAVRPRGFTERFYVVRGNEINAFCAPGGYVFVNEGLLRTVGNADELAGVLAHETAHLVLGHPQADMPHGKRGFIGSIGNVFSGKRARGSPNTFDLATKMGNYSFLNFTHEQEYAADALGAKLAAKAGYNPWGAVWFLGTIERLVGDVGFEQYVPQHPTASDRTDRIARELRADATLAHWKNHPPASTGLL